MNFLLVLTLYSVLMLAVTSQLAYTNILHLLNTPYAYARHNTRHQHCVTIKPNDTNNSLINDFLYFVTQRLKYYIVTTDSLFYSFHSLV